MVGYWNFNEGSGNTVTDLSGNGNNGTINGATWSTDAPAQYVNNCTATDDIVVTVNPLPTIDLGADTTLICAGTSETLDAGTGFDSYLWSDGSTAQTLSATTAGTYNVTGTDANGCTASDSMVIDVLTVSITQNDTTICEGDSIDMLVSISKGTPPSKPGLTYYGTYNYNYYYTSNIDADAPTAISNCSAVGGHLVTVLNDFEENVYVSSILPGIHFWIGYTDELVEGTFVWVDGSTSTYTNWANNDSNNSGPSANEDYTLINASGSGDGYWNDGDNNSSFPYVCEFNNNYTISWSPGGEITSSINVKPSNTTTYTVNVTSESTTCNDDVSITVNQRDFVTVDSTACTSIEWKGTTVSSSGTYYDTLQNAAGCDSIVT